MDIPIIAIYDYNMDIHIRFHEIAPHLIFGQNIMFESWILHQKYVQLNESPCIIITCRTPIYKIGKSLYNVYLYRKEFLQMRVEILPLHEHPKYLMDCCKILNDEWKRSNTARLHSLKSSCKQLPTSLILLEEKILIGHLKLSSIPSVKNACFVESVVIDKYSRGKGYGSVLMKGAESYCRNILKLDRIYLSTKGQEQFYLKLGYIECTPISIYGCYSPKMSTDQNDGKNRNGSTIDAIMLPTSIPKPPPQPDLSPTKQSKTFMMKDL